MSSRLSNTARSSVTLFWTVLPLLIVEMSVSQLPAQDKTTEKARVAQEKRSLEFLVSDEDSQPLKAAKLYANVAYLNESSKSKIVNSNLVTNAAGLAKLSLPPGTRSMRLWVSKNGYVSEFVSFGEGVEDEDRKIPTHFAFQLARGTKISGIVVDANGKPVPDVKVSVNVNGGEPDLSSDPQPIVSINAEAVTDKAGKWSINIAPAKRAGDDIEFRLKFTHPDYLSDSKWGELQNQQNLTTAMLRDGSAQIVLRQGIAVKGTVYNTAGDPITKGIIVWHDEPYYGSTVHEVEIGKSGTFETIPLPPGKHPITVVAPGFKPTRQIVDVSKSMDELTVTMKPGKTLTLKIVDTSGKPVPKAHVGLRKWNGVKSLYNWRHPNVLNSGIPTHADENGVYVWNWAPDDPVTYQIYGGSCAAKEVTLVATEKEHVIKLDRPLIASGNVTDTATGKPVTMFRVIPVIEFGPDFLSTSFDNAVIGKAGKYKITLNSGLYDRRHLIRIEADGYRSALSDASFGLGDGPVTQDFSLERVSARKGLVIDHSGKPVPDVTIRVGTPSIVPIIQNGESDRQGMPDNTSAEGEFQIAATFEPTRIRATHESGFGEVVRQSNEAIGILTLQPWATVSGRLFQTGKPVADALISFKTVHDRKLGEPRFQDSFYTKTDAAGHFEFKQLPPIPGAVHAYLGPWEESPLTSSQSVSLDLQPGDHKTLSLGNTGATLTGTVVATGRGEATLNKNWSLNYLIRRDDGIPLPEDFPKPGFDPAGPVQASWILDPHFYSWLRSRQHYFVKLSPEGQLQIGGVPPGDYDLVLRLYEQPAGCLVEAVGVKVIPVTVTAADIKAKTKDLGSIEVACRVGPRAGENMYAYKFTDTTGREHSIYDLKGRYILLHVWASWCAPCLKSMPDIQATAVKLADKPITLVGLNIDQYPEDGEILVEKNKWNWAQNYLGDQSEMARQLAISSVPVYYLIGPDGKLKASTTEWPEMKAALKETFNQNP